MEPTGNLILGSSLVSASLICGVSLFLARRAWRLVSNLDELKAEFELLHERIDESLEPELVNLSMACRALKKQMERGRGPDKRLLERSLRKAREGKGIFPTNKTQQLYYAAWRKLLDLKREMG